MKTIEKFILLEANEFETWIQQQAVTRKIKWVQQHHTYIPSYKQFTGNNHFELCKSMDAEHKKRGFDEIAQNFTIFPDGKIMVCRDLDIIPAGIKGANTFGVCVENVGNFDRGQDIMASRQRDSIVLVTKAILKKFSLVPSDQSVVYHHWYDLYTGKRIPREGKGSTKTCPGTGFFGGNSVLAFNTGMLPMLK